MIIFFQVSGSWFRNHTNHLHREHSSEYVHGRAHQKTHERSLSQVVIAHSSTIRQAYIVPSLEPIFYLSSIIKYVNIIRIELYDVKIVYDVTKLTKAHNELLDALSCYEYGVKYKDKHDRGLSMYPHCCSR